MTIVASFAQIPLMWAVSLTRVVRSLDLYTKPLFETICDSFRISLIQYRSPNTFATLTSLMPNNSIVLTIVVEAYSDRNHLA